MEITCKGTAEEIYRKVKPKLQYYQETRKLQIEAVTFDDLTHTASARGMGFTASIKCSENLVTVDLTLNFLLRPIRGKVEAGIRENFERLLG